MNLCPIAHILKAQFINFDISAAIKYIFNLPTQHFFCSGNEGHKYIAVLHYSKVSNFWFRNTCVCVCFNFIHQHWYICDGIFIASATQSKQSLIYFYIYSANIELFITWKCTQTINSWENCGHAHFCRYFRPSLSFPSFGSFFALLLDNGAQGVQVLIVIICIHYTRMHAWMDTQWTTMRLHNTQTIHIIF